MWEIETVRMRMVEKMALEILHSEEILLATSITVKRKPKKMT
jgi:hypothetical protein